MTNWYTGLRAVKTAIGINGVEKDLQIGRMIESASRDIDDLTRTYFIPKTETRLYRWPQWQPSRSTILWLDQNLISVSTLQTKAQDTSPTTISSSDYFLEPVNTGPPYDRIEIDLSSTAAFESGDTPQRSISVAGDFGFRSTTKSAGTVDDSGGISSGDTALIVSNAASVDIGLTLLIDSERIFVTDQTFAALDSILLNGALTANKSNVTVTVDGSHGIVANEIIRVDAEEMYVERVSTNDLTVERAYNGTTLASHNDDTAVHINRTLTIERAVNGTTAASHGDTTAISVYEPPFQITNLCLAMAVNMYHLETGGYLGQAGRGDARLTAPTPGSFDDYQAHVIRSHKRHLQGVV